MRRIFSTETMTVGILAIVFGLVGAYGVRSLLMQAPPPAEVAEPETVHLPTATSDLPANRVVAVGDIATITLTREQLRARKYPGLVMTKADQIIGRRLREPVKQGQPFLTGSLYLAGTGPDVTDKLKPGFRAFSLRIPDVRGGTVMPGTFVDLLFRTEPRPADVGISPIPEMTVTLLSHVEVIGVERTAGGGMSPNSSGPLIVLAVPAEKVAGLQVIEGRGEFSLAMRPPGESLAMGSYMDERATLDGVLGIRPPPPPVPPPAPVQTAIYRRGRLQVNTFMDDRLIYSSGSPTAPGMGAAPGVGAAPGGADADAGHEDEAHYVPVGEVRSALALAAASGVTPKGVAPKKGGCKNCGKKKPVPVPADLSPTPQPDTPTLAPPRP